MSTAPVTIHFDEIERHPDDAVTAYSHFAPSESVLRDLVDELFAKNWSRITTLVQIKFLADRLGQHLTVPWWLRSFYETLVGP